MEHTRDKWQSETFAAVQRDALVSARKLLPALVLVPGAGANQTDFIEPHGSAASVALANARWAAASDGHNMARIMSYWCTLVSLLDADLMTTTAQLGHRSANTNVQPRYYRTLVGDYAATTMVLARRILDDEQQPQSLRLLHASRILRHAASELETRIPDAGRVQSRLDAAGLTGGTRYLSAASLVLEKEALLSFAMIDGRDRLPTALNASDAWNLLLSPVVAEFHRSLPTGASWTGAMAVYKAAKERSDQYRALILLERMHELEASAVSLSKQDAGSEQNGLHFVRLLGAANHYARTIDSITTRLRQFPPDWLDRYRVRLSADSVQAQIADIRPQMIEEHEFKQPPHNETSAAVDYCINWMHIETQLFDATRPTVNVDPWADIIQHVIVSAPEDDGQTWNIPLLCLALARCGDRAEQRAILRDRLVDLGAPMDEFDRIMADDLSMLFARLGIEPPAVMDASPPPPPVNIVKSLWGRLFRPASSSSTNVAPVTPQVESHAETHSLLLAPEVVATWGTAAGMPTPDPMPTADIFVSRIGGTAQLDAWLPRHDNSAVLRILAWYRPVEWTRIIGLTPAMLDARQINVRTLDIAVRGWTMREVLVAFFSTKK